MEGASKNLTLHKADLVVPGSFDDIISGCDLVLHVASVFSNEIHGAAVEEKLIKPARDGTANVLSACNKAESVRRVVVTSSVAAIYHSGTEHGDVVLDETYWNNTSSSEANPYFYSKVLAERKAWEMAKAQMRYRLCVVNPGFVMGPPATSRASGESITMAQRMFSGQFSRVPDFHIMVVDVRDVAKAHLLAGTCPDAEGRYVAVERTHSIVEWGKVIKHATGYAKVGNSGTAPYCLLWCIGPCVGIPRNYVTENWGKVITFDHSKCEKLGVDFIPLEDTMRDMHKRMKETKMIK